MHTPYAIRYPCEGAAPGSLHSGDTVTSESCHAKSPRSFLWLCAPNGIAKVRRAKATMPKLQTSPRSVRCDGSNSGAEYSVKMRNWRDSCLRSAEQKQSDRHDT